MKKTPFDLVCEFLNHHTSCPKDMFDFDCDCETTCIDNCAKCWRKYFEQQADIPDGWEIVIEIYKNICNSLEKNIKDGEIKVTKEFGELDNLGRFVYNKLKQAGIEV